MRIPSFDSDLFNTGSVEVSPVEIGQDEQAALKEALSQMRKAGRLVIREG